MSCPGDTSLEAFAEWVLESRRGRETEEDSSARSELTGYFDLKNEAFDYSFLTSEAAYFIWRMSKFSRHYTRPVLQRAGLTGSDDFAILSHVECKKECTKKVAITENLLELTTGTDIIKHLVAKKLLSERLNPTDRREKLLSVARKGKLVLERIYSGFASIQDILADLPDSDRILLVNMLRGLDHYHTQRMKDAVSGHSL